MSLSLHWPSCVTFNWSVWHNSTESPRMKRALWFFSPLVTLLGDFSLVTLVEGRAWDGKSDSKWISTKTQLWCINILANLNHKSLDRGKIIPVQKFIRAGGWKFTGSDNIWGRPVKKPMLWSVQFTSRIDLFMSGFTWSADQCKIDGHTITHEFCRRRQNTKFNPCQW